jgi:hypothetical protein
LGGGGFGAHTLDGQKTSIAFLNCPRQLIRRDAQGCNAFENDRGRFLQPIHPRLIDMQSSSIEVAFRVAREFIASVEPIVFQCGIGTAPKGLLLKVDTYKIAQQSYAGSPDVILQSSLSLLNYKSYISPPTSFMYREKCALRHHLLCT